MVPAVGYATVGKGVGRGGGSFLNPEQQRQHIADD